MEAIKNTTHTSGPWVYEESTKTIRAYPSNYWLATVDSWDGAANHEANARLIAAAPELLEALESMQSWAAYMGGWEAPCWEKVAAAIRKARGE